MTMLLLRGAAGLRGEAEANSFGITRLLHFVGNDILNKIATGFALAMTLGVNFVGPGSWGKVLNCDRVVQRRR
ncbi:MAG: hypothetical protein ACETVT_05215 [bacterium]